MLVEPLPAPHEVGAEVELHPFRRLEGEVGGQIPALRPVEIDPQHAEHVGIVGVGAYRLVDLVLVELDAGREGVFVRHDERQADILLIGGV